MRTGPPDRAHLLAQVFARLRWCVGGEFSVSLTPEMCEVVLEALDGQAVGSSIKPPCLFPLPDGRRCCECETCHAERPRIAARESRA